MLNNKLIIMKKITFYFATLLLMVVSNSFAQSDTNCWKMLSTGLAHVVAINEEGSLFTWGRNNYGQLGDGTGDKVESKPKEVFSNSKFKFVTTGTYTSFAISTTGQLYACGRYAIDGTGTSKRWIKIGTDTDWKSVYSSEWRTIFLKENGTMWGYTNNSTHYDINQIGTDTDWKTFTTPTSFVIALKNNGTMWSWGVNKDGTLGNGTTTDHYEPAQIGTGTDWVSISAQYGHILALKTDGTLWGWGMNQNYQLGNGTNISSSIPIQIGTDNDWTFIKAGNKYSVGVKTNGTLWTWGDNGDYGVLGNPTNKFNPIPTQVGTDTNWKSVSGAEYFVTAIKTDGSLWAWGLNSNSNFGNGNNKNSLVPLLVGGCTNLGNEKWESNSLTVYPNPSNGIFNIQTSASIENASITISDLNGRIVHQSKVENLQNKTLYLNHVQSGLYILNISSGNYNYSQKIVKQ